MESESETKASNPLQFPSLDFFSLLNSHLSTFPPQVSWVWIQDVTSNKAFLRLCILLKDEISLVCTRTSRERDVGPQPTWLHPGLCPAHLSQSHPAHIATERHLITSRIALRMLARHRRHANSQGCLIAERKLQRIGLDATHFRWRSG